MPVPKRLNVGTVDVVLNELPKLPKPTKITNYLYLISQIKDTYNTISVFLFYNYLPVDNEVPVPPKSDGAVVVVVEVAPKPNPVPNVGAVVVAVAPNPVKPVLGVVVVPKPY